MPTLVSWNDEIKFEVPEDKFKTPSSISEVQQIVKQAQQQNEKVRVVGAMHSTTECMVGRGIVISMAKMNNILTVDEDNMTATVQAGASIHQLCAHLKPLGLQPPVILEYGNFQIGAISGTQANDSSLSDSAQFSSFVVGVKLVAANGEVCQISERHNQDFLPAIRSHYGLFGVVCEVTIRLEETQSLHFTYQMTTLDAFSKDMAANMKMLRSTSDQAFGLLFQANGKFMIQCRKYITMQDMKKMPNVPSFYASPITDAIEAEVGEMLNKELSAVEKTPEFSGSQYYIMPSIMGDSKGLRDIEKKMEQDMLQRRSQLEQSRSFSNTLQARAINLYADVVLPLAKIQRSLNMSAEATETLSTTLVDLPLKLLQHSHYTIDPNTRAILYKENDPNFDFYDWVFPEEKWPAMAKAWVDLCNRFEREQNFVLTLPALIYFIKQDRNSLLSRSRHGNMIAVDPEYQDPTDPKWLEFRHAFSELAMHHGGIPHINKTRDGAIHYFAKAFDQDALREYLNLRKHFDPQGMFMNDFFATMFKDYL